MAFGRVGGHDAQNVQCVITTGINTLSEGVDIVVEGDALRVRDKGRLQSVADKYSSKYGPPFNFTVRDSNFFGEGGKALVFEVIPTTVFGFGKGKIFSQTRWRFS